MIKNLVNFDALNEYRYNWASFSEEFKESMQMYLIHGYQPGGFGTSMLACDYERGLYCADTHNRKVFWAIAMWIRECCPSEAWGSYDKIDMWRDDFGNRRTNYVKSLEQKHIMDVLSV